jgi:hypothetical protein
LHLTLVEFNWLNYHGAMQQSNPKFKVELERGTPWGVDDVAFFYMHLEQEAHDEQSIRLKVTASFVPYDISQGDFVKTTIFVGCTGALFKVRTDSAEFATYTTAGSVDVTYTSIQKNTLTGTFSPKVAVKGGDLEVSAEAGSIAKGKEIESGSSFKGKERPLEVTLIGKNVLRWSYHLHRGMKVFREYLEGNLPLSAEGHWKDGVSPTFWIEGKPLDRVFFGGVDRRKLGRISSLALRAKLWYHNINVPSVDAVRFRLCLIED